MSSGHNSKAGYVDATNWGDAGLTSSISIPLVSESITKSFDLQRSKALHGQASPHEPKHGHQMVTGSLVTEFDYSASGLLEYAMGNAAGTVYTFTDDLDQQFHLEIDKVVERYRHASCKVGSLTISGEAGSEDPIQASYELISHRETRIATAFGGPALTTDPVMFTDLGYLRLGDQADALTSGDAVCIKNFEISIDNALEGTSKCNTDDFVLEPIRSGLRMVTLKIGFARYNSTGIVAALDGWRNNQTRLQSSMLFTNGASSYIIDMPELRIVEGDTWTVGGPGIIEGEVTLEAFVNNHNTPMVAVSDQMQIVLA
jgi:Phage tail tube protein